MRATVPASALLLAMYAASLVSAPVASAAATEPADPRLREVNYDPLAVVTVPVKRGIVTLVVLGADESITDVAAGLGADCAKPEAAWCVAAQPGGRTFFVKPKSTASAANNLAVVTDRRTHAFRFVVLADNDPRPAIFRLAVKAPIHPAPGTRLAMREVPALAALPAIATPPSPQQLVTERLQAKPSIMNTRYSIAEGKGSQDIVPTLVFDDGRFTYLRFPGNREIPAVFHVLGDGSETLVNSRMEDDLLVIDRVSRQLMLRAGSAVAGIWNEAFDLDGRPPIRGTTAPGVQRVLKAEQLQDNGYSGAATALGDRPAAIGHLQEDAP